MNFLSQIFKKSFLALCFAVILFALPKQTFARATASLLAPTPPVVGQLFAVDVLADPDGVMINSADISLSFPSGTFTFKGYQQGEGAISIWVVSPQEKEKGKIQFSGVMPGGVERFYDPMNQEEKAIPLVRLLFMPTEEGAASFSITNAVFLRNDGEGTQIIAALDTLSTTSGAPRGQAVAQIPDATPPTQFSIERLPGSPFGGTPDLVIFGAIDTESGIARYEVSYDGEKFTEVQSPYVLPKRLFPYTLTARAVDFAGNYTDTTLFVPVKGTTPLFLLIALGGTLVIVIYIRRRRRDLP